MIARSIKSSLYRLGVSRWLSQRRLQRIDQLMDGLLLNGQGAGMRILDVGCSQGKDMVSFLVGREDLEIVGLDLRDQGLRQTNFHMVLGDAAALPFSDDYFDVAISVGVLEHILPIEKLARVAREIRRVARGYVVVVPSLGSMVEPHTARFLWHLRDRRTKPAYSGTLSYMSDEAWLGLGGFQNAQTFRYSHLPPLINNLVIFEKKQRPAVQIEARSQC